MKSRSEPDGARQTARIMETASSRTFADRRSAGEALARAVRKEKLSPPVIVLGLPRGGVPVAFEVARELNAPLDVLVVRKVGMPGQRELAVGAIAAGGVQVREPTFATYLTRMGVNFDELADAERVELDRRERAYRASAAPLDLTGKTVVLVDDGLATGSTMLAAVRSARKAHAGSVVVAAPVASDEAAALVGGEADKLVVLKIPAFLSSIGQWYDDFRQIDDDEVQALLKQPSPATQAASDSE